jgi:hypothetical protein
MSQTVNAGARLDRLPLSAFHRRIFWLIGAGMFFDGYEPARRSLEQLAMRASGGDMPLAVQQPA